MHAILNAPTPSDWDGIRDRAMLHLCFAGGLRVSELVGLQLSDVTLQPQATVLVHGKGRRERCLPLWKVTATALRAWLAVRATVPAPEVFVSARGQPLTRAGFEYILAKHVQTASKACPSLSAKRVSPHVLRHTCATHLLRGGADIRHVQELLGHRSLATTALYTRVAIEDLRQVLARAHPRR